MTMELTNLHILVLVLCVQSNFVKMEECGVRTSSTGTFEYFNDIEIQSTIQVGHMLLNSCIFGKIMEISEEHLCFGHCLLRDNCIAVKTSFEGCQMCYLNELTDDVTPFDHGSSRIYIRQDVFGKILCYCFLFKNNRILIWFKIVK